MDNKDLQDKIKKLVAEQKLLEKSMNPFNENFSFDKKQTLIKITNIKQQIINLQTQILDDYPAALNPFAYEDIDSLQENNNRQMVVDTEPLVASDTISINSQELIEMWYGKTCCPRCTIL